MHIYDERFMPSRPQSRLQSNASVSEYRLLMSAAQMRKAEWVLLAAAPGGVLLVGGLVWLRRRR